MSKLFIYIVLSLLFIIPGYSQDLMRDIERINTTYKMASQFHMVIDYKLFPSYESAEAYENTTAIIYKDDEGYYSKLFEQETIVNTEHVILIDHDSDLFMIDYFQAGSTTPNHQTLPDNDSLSNLIQTLVDEAQSAYQDIERSEGLYSIRFNFGELEKMMLSFDPESLLFKKVILYYRAELPILEGQNPQKPRLEVTYRTFDTNPTFPKDIFSTERYASVIPEKLLKLKGKMKEYTIINHLWLDIAHH